MKSVEKSPAHDPNLFLLVAPMARQPPNIDKTCKKDIEAVDLAVFRSTISAVKVNVAEKAREALLLTLYRKEIRPCDS
jgi:hypothetical protein